MAATRHRSNITYKLCEFGLTCLPVSKGEARPILDRGSYVLGSTRAIIISIIRSGSQGISCYYNNYYNTQSCVLLWEQMGQSAYPTPWYITFYLTCMRLSLYNGGVCTRNYCHPYVFLQVRVVLHSIIYLIKERESW